MLKTILISGVFLIVIFLLMPDNRTLNDLGIKMIGLYFFAGIVYFPIVIILWLFFNIRSPIGIIDDFIYEKFLKKWFLS
ncbi:hypothetical protein [Helicobacter sp. 11S03491-1]|uniref:hypothetical protein n=1 Tax=Helicobacter sp. 11S03491-1 TaxID=1476196 RepID=UPI000BA68345|nr:hypothetical protein [Helicobacter sp. 11S03491-1]PAF41313.1 hypothetical protein BKH45_07345 [Helicobacter sp. 11S03491-1]